MNGLIFSCNFEKLRSKVGVKHCLAAKERSESLEFFGDTQSYDNVDYDDYMTSVDDDY